MSVRKKIVGTQHVTCALLSVILDARDPILKENSIKYKPDVAYLTDLYTIFNKVNLQLRGTVSM